MVLEGAASHELEVNKKPWKIKDEKE